MTDSEPLIFPVDGGIKPLPGDRVMVITKDLLCPGYIDFDGNWHRDSDGMQINDVIGWSPKKSPS